MTPEDFARAEYRDYRMYMALAGREKDAAARRALEEFAAEEKEHYEFWIRHATVRSPAQDRAGKDLERGVVSPSLAPAPSTREKLALRLIFILRAIFGPAAVIALIERKEHAAINRYREFLKTADPTLHDAVAQMIRDEESHERHIITDLGAGQSRVIGNIVLGLNDGLIELTGALTGFAFAFGRNSIVGMTGLIVGVAAALSMAASAYMQARHEEGKNPPQAAGYTGTAYGAVVFLLIAPFFLLSGTAAAVAVMFVLAFAVVGATSFYTSLLFDRPFLRQFGEMILFSLGAAAVSFLVGLATRRVFQIDVST
ncbi:MAG: VIT1/CCC1 transporter family protein [Patescibacteria group bacterium]